MADVKYARSMELNHDRTANVQHVKYFYAVMKRRTALLLSMNCCTDAILFTFFACVCTYVLLLNSFSIVIEHFKFYSFYSMVSKSRAGP